MTPAPQKPVGRLSRRLFGWAMAALLVAAGTTVAILAPLDPREEANRKAAYSDASSVAADADRQKEDIQNRIALLLTPRNRGRSIGRDDIGRTIEAALLYGRLSLLEEQQGNAQQARRFMQDAIGLLQQANHPNPTEAHIRATIAAQARPRARP